MTRDAVIKLFKQSANKYVEEIAREIGRKAQSNFNRFEAEASCDDPSILVSVKGSGGNCQVSCYGEQVIFIEFGVGAMNASYTVPEWTSAKYQPIDDKSWSVKFGRGGGYERPSFGFAFINNKFTEIAPRDYGITPAGAIKELGGYGKGYGKDDFWIRPTRNGRKGKNESNVHIKDKNGNDIGIRTDVVWTTGHKPARALYRAIASARRKNK